VESYPLYEWTKATVGNPSKKEKHLKSFTVYVDGREVYDREIADAVEADLQPLASGFLAPMQSMGASAPHSGFELPQTSCSDRGFEQQFEMVAGPRNHFCYNSLAVPV
jgi:hypothetical protein